MIVYLSGNFPQLSKIEKEREFKRKLEAEGRCYHRLGTFFYPKAMDTVLKLKSEEGVSKWHRAYMNRMIEAAGLTEDQALEALNATMDDLDYTTSPEDSADEEISYWAE
jgi:hypothetical protein